MPFVNNSLGNAFRIKQVDGDKEDQYYFGGTQKFLKARYRLLSGTTAVPFLSSTFSISGTFIVNSSTASLNGQFTDGSGEPLTPDFAHIYALFSASAGAGYHPMYNAVLTFEVSSSGATIASGTLNSNDFSVIETSDFLNLVNFDISRDSVQILDNTTGFTKYYCHMLSGASGDPPLFSFTGSAFPQDVGMFSVRVVGAVDLTFKNFELSFDHALTRDGIVKYNEIDNQHNEFNYIGFPMGKVE